MGSYMNFKNFGETPQNQCTGSKPSVSTPLVRQSSIFELTFDEFQNTLGGSGKDFGSMNMDEFLKNIWTAEETQAMATSAVLGQGSSNAPSGNLQRQGSLTLPRILSQKTVDEVWREMYIENSGVKDVNPPNLQQQQRQPTLGEVTLEEFLFKAGVTREDAQQMARANNNGFYNGGSSEANNNTGLTIGFQQPPHNNIVTNNMILENNNILVPNQPSSLPMNVSGIRPSQQLPQPLFPKQSTVTFTSSMPIANNTQLASPGTRIADPSIRNGLFQSGPLGMGGLFPGAQMSGAMASPAKQLSPDGETSSVSPPSYRLGDGGRGRKSGTLEKATERRHKRMIKNRESAARSRARKQAYTIELEAEIAKLKEMNDELRKKQDEIMEMQKNQAPEPMNMPWGSKKRCLRRTLTGPW